LVRCIERRELQSIVHLKLISRVASQNAATDCLNRLHVLVRQMETSLGPDTGDLSIRIGLHSGPVTAGVLRGDKGRFQLFGDTMNTASRMETTGEAGRIHVSQVTAEILVAAGKGKWVTQRQDQVIAKGKGALQTFWFKIISESHATGSNLTNDSSVAGEDEAAKSFEASTMIDRALHLGTAPQPDDSVSAPSAFTKLSSKEQRLVSWNVDILLKLLQQIIAHRESMGGAPKLSRQVTSALLQQKRNILDEVKEVLALPQLNATMIKKVVDPTSIEVPQAVVAQLTDMVTKIARLYSRKNPFHNFEHASHVTMSVTKLMSRIVAGDTTTVETVGGTDAVTRHDNTFGITSDPLTQFACVVSGLIHDAGKSHVLGVCG
jgi:Adenylate and Guanylate cyclase catalytic domain